MKTKFLLLSCIAFISVFASCKKDDEFGKLTAAFTADKEAVKAGEEITFSDKSSGQPAKWKWTFEGGSPDTSALSSPKVVYETPGTYSVTLEINNADGSNSIKKEAFITVSYNDIGADFEADKTTIMQNESITFKDLSSGLPNSWKWEFIPASGTPITSTEQNPAITFTEFGVYTVKLTASNPEHSAEVVKTDYITVLDITSVEAAFTSNETATYSGGSIDFTDQSAGNATSWSWTFEGGTPAVSNAQNPSVTYNTPGRYKVKLVVSNPFKSSTVEKEGYIVVVPGAGLSAYFPFNGNIHDVGPSKVTSNMVGTIAFSGQDRKSAESRTAVFNGSSAVIIPNHDAFNFGLDDYSVSFWVKTSQTKKMFIWMESGKGGSKDNQTWCRIGNNTTSQLLQFATEDGSGGTFVSIGEPGRVSDNVWHHVVCVRQGLKTRVYVDGIFIQEGTAPAVRNVSNAADFKIGAQEGSSGYSNFLNGTLDDVIIYKKALTEAEVSELFNL